MENDNQVVITDVGPRDGLQNQQTVLSVEQRLSLIQGLVDAGLPSIEAGAFVSPKAIPCMAGTDQLYARLNSIQSVNFQALIPNLRGYQLAAASGARHVMVVVCATESMNQKNVRMSVSDSVAQLADIVSSAAADGISVTCCIAVSWHCPFEGTTNPRSVIDLARRIHAMGIQQLIFADTIGAANPLEVKNLMKALGSEFGTAQLACHFHDTRAMGLANVFAALETGVRRFDASVGGLGGCPFAPGATGNVATEDVVMMLEQMGMQTGIDLIKLTQVGQLAGQLTGQSTGGRAAAWHQLQIEK